MESNKIIWILCKFGFRFSSSMYCILLDPLHLVPKCDECGLCRHHPTIVSLAINLATISWGNWSKTGMPCYGKQAQALYWSAILELRCLDDAMSCICGFGGDAHHYPMAAPCSPLRPWFPSWGIAIALLRAIVINLAVSLEKELKVFITQDEKK